MGLNASFAGMSVGADSLKRILEITHGPLEARMPEDFAAVARNQQHGEVTIGRVAAPANSAKGGSLHRDGLPGGGFLICIHQLSGAVAIAQEGRAVRVEAGDFGFYATDRPYELHFEEEYELIAVCFPIEWARAYGPAGASALSAARIGREDPLAASLGPALDALEQHLEELKPGLRGRVIGQMLDAVELLATHASGPARPEPGDRADLLQRAHGVIEERLTDPELSPAAVAAALFVSERTLYAAFRQAGLSIAGTIRTRRLEQARRELIDPTRAGESVSGIAAHWGFSSSTHFSALFRDVFGSSPSAYRATHAG